MASSGRTALYRLYDSCGVLLYVGITNNPEVRWAWHRDRQAWWPAVAAKKVEWFNSRIDAAKAEATAVRTEHPSKNVALPNEDGLGGWTPIPGRRTELRIRMIGFNASDELWGRFGDAVRRSPDPEADMSKVLRQLVRWFAGEPGAELPKRPDAKEEPTS